MTNYLLNEMRKENNPIKKQDLRKAYKVLCNRICEEKRQGKRNFNAMKFNKHGLMWTQPERTGMNWNELESWNGLKWI